MKLTMFEDVFPYLQDTVLLRSAILSIFHQ